ncbi:Murein DD-endopeptidase MepM and murein hydrolase activator NlpD, contain LysM domain [Paracoccus solventivorans]|uniref:Murein DD-endopeptidase MepM and murein hydrolase activator NlpD, contain LysM domain n=1 Tax=Paracoccus solventivorans TaxID=53463 RepID=A0A1M7DJ17_9RHOB|nr:Murein DD-endopeptidase MepM and murein hydrolase activator NlpD, contain LysM domain [Paracoccus solventivorans]
MTGPDQPSTAATAGQAGFRPLLRRFGMVVVTGWAMAATSILALDALGVSGAGPQAAATTATQQQLAELIAQRDARAAEAASAQSRFTAALDQLSAMQTQLLTSEEKRRELESGIGAIQASLHDALARNADADRRLAAADTQAPGSDEDLSVALDILSGELETIAARSAEADQRATEAVRTAEALELERDEILRRNEEIFAQLEAAVEQSVKPLDDMIKKVGVDSDRLLATVRKGYGGTGGPLTPMGYSTRGNAAITENEARAQEVMVSLGKFDNYRIAVSKLPLAMPVKSAFRFSSHYGARWGRQHQGIDMAAPVGTPVFATGDGVVVFAGWQRGYGNLIKIKHELGTETRYAHLSKIRVKQGQRVSRNTLIGDIGNTGRSTGPHLHYEVRVDGKAVNPMSFIKAAQNVF